MSISQVHGFLLEQSIRNRIRTSMAALDTNPGIGLMMTAGSPETCIR